MELQAARLVSRVNLVDISPVNVAMRSNATDNIAIVWISDTVEVNCATKSQMR